MSNVVWINSGAGWRRRAAAQERGFMSDFDFDARLERLYAQPPRVSDPEGFTRRVNERLEREWGVRRLAISALGLAGAAVAVSQTLGSETVGRLAAMAEPARKVAAESVAAQGWAKSLES